MPFGLLDLVADHQSTDDLIPRHAVPVVDNELETDTGEYGDTTAEGRRRTARSRQIKDEGFVEDWIQRLLLDVRFLLSYALPVVRQTYLHVRICISYQKSNYFLAFIRTYNQKNLQTQ